MTTLWSFEFASLLIAPELFFSFCGRGTLEKNLVVRVGYRRAHWSYGQNERSQTIQYTGWRWLKMTRHCKTSGSPPKNDNIQVPTLKRCKTMGLPQTQECFNSLIYFLHQFLTVPHLWLYATFCFLGHVDQGDFEQWFSYTPTISKMEVWKEVCSVQLMFLTFQLFWAWGPLLATNSFFGADGDAVSQWFHTIIIGENAIASWTDPNDSHDNSHMQILTTCEIVRPLDSLAVW